MTEEKKKKQDNLYKANPYEDSASDTAQTPIIQEDQEIPKQSASEKVAQWWETNGLKADKDKLEQDEARQRRQKNIANTTSAFKTLAEGIYGTKGYRIPKATENKEYTAADKEINRLRANYDREAQRAKEAKMYAGLRAMNADTANERTVEREKQRVLTNTTATEAQNRVNSAEIIQKQKFEESLAILKNNADLKRMTDVANINKKKTENVSAARVKIAQETTKRLGLKIAQTKEQKEAAERKGDFTFQNNKDTIIIPKEKFNAVYEEIRAALQEEIENADFKKKLGYPAAIMDKGKLKYTLTPAQQRRVVRDYYNLIHPKAKDKNSISNALPKQEAGTPKKTKTSTGEGNWFSQNEK